MAQKLNFRREYYTAVADLLVVTLGRDLVSFSKHFTGMNEGYLKGFKEAIDALKEAEGATSSVAQLKENNQKLYAVLKQLKEKYAFIKQYAVMATIDSMLITKTINLLKTRNVEGIALSIRESLAFLQANKERLTHMPEGFLDEIPTLVAEAEKYNLLQSTISSEGKRATQGRKPLYDAVYAYISQVSAAGKLIYKNDVRREEYTISKIINKMQGGVPKQAETQGTNKRKKSTDAKKSELDPLYSSGK